MKKIILSALAIGSFAIAQAQKKDSTNCDKLNAKLNTTIRLYTDSLEQIRLTGIKNKQAARKQFYADSIAGKLPKDAVSPQFMTPALKEEYISTNKRKAIAIKAINSAIKKENCEEAANNSQKPVNNKN